MNNQDMPAAPVPSELLKGQTHSDYYFDYSGLTKLEAFTMAAMQGLCANPQVVDGRQWTSLQSVAVDIAKATLAELENQE